MKLQEGIYKSRVRPDGKAKVTGSLRYLTDLSFPGMLYGKILRSEYPHAKISRIRTERAKRLPGVVAVITHKDVPGLNGFGLIFPDQPVLCKNHVRYVGDAVAAVAAESIEIAEKALTLIEVDYEPLPIIDSPEKGLDPKSPLLHSNGNVLHRASYLKGKIDVGFENCKAIVEETYEVPRQMHTYMETEGGVIVPEEGGKLTVYVGTQHGYKDRFQLARILAMEEDDIRIISSPMGGSFGGKDELNIQPYGALLAIKSGRPVKIHQTRKESMISGLKRHPMKIKMKTGVDEEGHLLAHQVEILADTGAYATLGPAILDFAVEHASGSYLIPNVDVNGVSVFTNNGVSGEFRGFGGNQITFALEAQMDRLADQLKQDPFEFRKRNIRKESDLGPLGQRIAPTNGASDVLEGIRDIYQIKKSEAEKFNSESEWKKRGIGLAITMHGGGLGYGRLDPAGGQLKLTEDGKIEVAFGFEECGQGILGVIETIVLDELGVGAKDLKIVIGDTDSVPHTGSTTASRGTSMVWMAVQRMKGIFTETILERTSSLTGVPKTELALGSGGVFRGNASTPLVTYHELVMSIPKEAPILVSTQFDFPTTPDKIEGHFLYSFAAVVTQVEIDVLTGQVKVMDLDQVVSAGPVVSSNGYRGQIEGGGVMALGYTLMEEALMSEGRYITKNLDSYLIPGISDVPYQLDVTPIETLSKEDVYGPRGVGEIGSVAVSPAITKAIHDAIDHWVTRLPVSSEEILHACHARGLNKWKKVKSL